MNLEKFEEQLLAAESVTDIGKCVMDDLRSCLNVTSGQFNPICPNIILEEANIAFSDLSDLKYHFEIFNSIVPILEKETVSLLDVLKSQTRSCNLERLMPQSELEKTISYNEYMRPFHAERELLAAMGTEKNMLGFISVSRSIKENSFSEDEFSYLVKVRNRAENKLESVILYQPDISDIQLILDALEAALPISTFLFDDKGNLVWLSQEGLLRLQTRLCTSLFGSNFVSDPQGMLAWLRSVAKSAVCNPKKTLDGSLCLNYSFLDHRERLCTRVVNKPDQPNLVLISIVTDARPANQKVEPQRLRRLGLSPKEAEVAALASEGYSVLNIAYRLNIKESTVQTHLKRIYAKLGICNRAELVQRIVFS